jgi:ribose transport system substrate-binding protein
MKPDKTRRLKGISLLVSGAIAVLFCLYVFYIVPLVSTPGGSWADGSVEAEDRSRHVLLVGRSGNESVLRQIFEGAQEEAKRYDCVVELYMPKTVAEEKGMQELLDYAAFTEPDGVIAFMDDGDGGVQQPVNRAGRNIPLITLAQYHPSVPQVSYIGTNYSELGTLIATESISCLGGAGSIIIINTSRSNNPNYSTLMSSLKNALSGNSAISTQVLDLPSQDAITAGSGKLRRELMSEEADLIVCLSVEDTIRTAQLVASMSYIRKPRIIGLGENEVANMYLAKGTVTELFSIDSRRTGKTAMRELFEYLRYGYANNYITTDVTVRRSGK